MSTTEHPHQLSVVIPFENAQQAETAVKVLVPDPELRPAVFSKKLSNRESDLIAYFTADTARSLRVGVNSFMDSLALVVECIEELSPGQIALRAGHE